MIVSVIYIIIWKTLTKLFTLLSFIRLIYFPLLCISPLRLAKHVFKNKSNYKQYPSFAVCFSIMYTLSWIVFTMYNVLYSNSELNKDFGKEWKIMILISNALGFWINTISFIVFLIMFGNRQLKKVLIFSSVFICVIIVIIFSFSVVVFYIKQMYYLVITVLNLIIFVFLIISKVNFLRKLKKFQPNYKRIKLYITFPALITCLLYITIGVIMFYDNKVIIGICFGLPNVIGGCYFIFEFALWVWLKKKQVIVEDNTNDIISILDRKETNPSKKSCQRL